MKNDHNASTDEDLDACIMSARNEQPAEVRIEEAQKNLIAAIRKQAPPQTSRSEKASFLEPWQYSRSRRPYRRMVGLSFSAAVLLVLVLAPIFFSPSGISSAGAAYLTAGELRILAPDGSETTQTCPLKHTAVEANITGFISRTIVRQQFTNPTSKKIEAVYLFPLPQDSAVDSMTMTIGERRIVGRVKPKQEARQIYNAARQAGHVAALLDQERPNIFSQSVANIEPGVKIEIEISYVETLKSESGLYEFTFPMTVAPRYSPADAKAVGSVSSDYTISPIAEPAATTPAAIQTRPGHDISLEVYLDAGTEIFDMESRLHTVDIDREGHTRAIVSLHNQREIPNRDFVLKYRLAQDRVTDAFLSSSNPRGSFFTLMLQPPRSVAPAQAVPKEMIFLIDRSGSMSGYPIEKAKETMRLCIEQMNPNDTFNLLSFSGGTGKCFEKPVVNNPDNRAKAQQYLADLHGSGGTEMMPAIMEALTPPPDPNHVRIVCFMTDGEIGNDFEIIDAVKKNAGTARVFAFGIGNSTNRFLLDAIAREGRGEVEYVTLSNQPKLVQPKDPATSSGIETKDSTAASALDAAHKFAQRIAAPVLTDITIDWGKLPVAEVYPKSIPDLFSSKPILVHGRLTGPATGAIWLRGKTASGPFERQINVTGMDAGPERRDSLDSLWARAKVAYLMSQDLHALQQNTFPVELRDEITSVGVQFSLMTQFTSFVAVDETSVTRGTEWHKANVPSAAPDGQSDVDGDNSDKVLWSFYEGAKVPQQSAGGFATRNGHGLTSLGTNVDFYSHDTPALVAAATPVPAQKQYRARFYAKSDKKKSVEELSKGTPLTSSLSEAEQNYGIAGGIKPVAPVINGIPDLQMGDMEGDLGVDNDYFVFTNKFQFSEKVADYDSTNGTVSRGDVWRVKGDTEPVATSSNSTTIDVRDSKEPSNLAALPATSPVPKVTHLALFKSELATTSPQSKLAPELHSLLRWQSILDADGNSSGTITVRSYHLRIEVRLASPFDVALRTIQNLGFTLDPVTQQPAGVIMGEIDVRNLGKLLQLDTVEHVGPGKA